MREADPKKPVSVWAEKDLLDGQEVDALVVILRSKGCFWSTTGGCLMCGYGNDCLDSVSAVDLADQFTLAMTRYADHPYVKIYTSGSFLDPREIPPEAQERILAIAGAKFKRVLVESRPEFITPGNIGIATGLVGNLEVAVGLETASDRVRAECVNKGFDFEDYSKACDTLEKAGAAIRTYLLLKPPYLTESQAINDVLESIKMTEEVSETISVNPLNVQKGTVVESLWRKGHYRPPWLWSLVEILANAGSRARVISAPSGAGTKRGAHNCGKCDSHVLNAVRVFNLARDPVVFRPLTCDCRERWLDLLDIEDLTGSSGDLARLTSP